MKIEDFFNLTRAFPSLRDEIQAEKFEEDLLVTKDGRYAKVLKVEKPFENGGLTRKSWIG